MPSKSDAKGRLCALICALVTSKAFLGAVTIAKKKHALVDDISMLKVTKAVQRYLNGKCNLPSVDLTVFLGKFPIYFDDNMRKSQFATFNNHKGMLYETLVAGFKPCQMGS